VDISVEMLGERDGDEEIGVEDEPRSSDIYA
jgi:hypothetical protein